MTKTKLYSILTGIFCSCLIISNILSFKVFEICGITLPTAVVIFPIVYICNDVMAEIYGFKNARNVILLAFGMNLVAVVAYNVAIALKAPIFFNGADAFALVLGSSIRVLIASFLAYLAGSLLNSYVMVRMKKKLEKQLMFRCIGSTAVGETVDAFIFISIAFYGTMELTPLVIMIASQALFKTVYEVICYPLTKLTINRIKRLPK